MDPNVTFSRFNGRQAEKSTIILTLFFDFVKYSNEFRIQVNIKKKNHVFRNVTVYSIPEEL